jgi:hypothetical protein
LVTHCHDYPPQIPTAETFQQLVDAYEIIPGGGGNGREQHRMRPGKIASPDVVEIRFGERGRGLFAAKRISAGTLIYEGGDDFVFRMERSFVGFLKLLPPPLQCDALLWSFAGKRHVVLVPDERGCVNHGGADGKNIVTAQDGGFKAKRDIEAGEELLDDYAEYMRFHRLDWYNSIRKDAWGDAEALDASTQRDSLDLYLKQGIKAPPSESTPPAAAAPLEDPWTLNEPYVLLLGPMLLAGMLLFFFRARNTNRNSGACKTQ